MTREEILERLIAQQIDGEKANTILYNSFLLISWLEEIAKEHSEYYIQAKPLFDHFRSNNLAAGNCLALTDLLALHGITRARSSLKKAQKDNIIQFPPWGIKLKD